MNRLAGTSVGILPREPGEGVVEAPAMSVLPRLFSLSHPSDTQVGCGPILQVSALRQREVQ